MLIFCFLAEKAFDEDGNLKQPKQLSINKVGHGMWRIHIIFFYLTKKKKCRCSFAWILLAVSSGVEFNDHFVVVFSGWNLFSWISDCAIVLHGFLWYVLQRYMRLTRSLKSSLAQRKCRAYCSHSVTRGQLSFSRCIYLRYLFFRCKIYRIPCSPWHCINGSLIYTKNEPIKDAYCWWI